jgi:hypothetical protein
MPPAKIPDGMQYQSSEWNMTFGSGIAAQYMLSPDERSGWSFSAAHGSIVFISRIDLAQIVEQGARGEPLFNAGTCGTGTAVEPPANGFGSGSVVSRSALAVVTLVVVVLLPVELEELELFVLSLGRGALRLSGGAKSKGRPYEVQKDGAAKD